MPANLEYREAQNMQSHLARTARTWKRDTSAWDYKLIDSHVAEAANKTPRRIAVVDNEKRISYADFHILINETRSALIRAGVRPGDVVSWQLPNWWEAIVIHHAIISTGGISNPLMTQLRNRELVYMLEQAQTKVLFIPQTFRGFEHDSLAVKLREVVPTLETVVVVRPTRASVFTSFTDFNSGTASHNNHTLPQLTRSADDAIVLLYTSGTESLPKGALHSHNTLGYENRTMIDIFSLSSDDVIFMPSPLTHVTGICYGVHLSPMLGATVVLQDIWEVRRGLELIERERCTFTVAATPFLHMLTHSPNLPDHDISSLRVFGCGGADVSPALIHTATANLDACVVRLYGSTELPTLSAGRCSDPLEVRASTDGRIISPAEVLCVDEDGNAVPAGTTGELLVRGPELFLGYLDETATSSSVTPDGWLRTGDLATVTCDGTVTIQGRKKDIIVRGGENISAKEIEDLLLEDQAVREVAIVAMPDPIMVEKMCAFVVPREGFSPTLAYLNENMIAKGLMKQKLPERLEIVPTLPRTASGKIQKFILRDQLRVESDQP